MKKLTTLFYLLAVLVSNNIVAQQNVGIGTTTPHASAALDITATGKGILVPRMSAANRPSSPATGLLIYQTDIDSGFYYYNGTAWKYLPQDQVTGNGALGQLSYFTSANKLAGSNQLFWDTTAQKLRIGNDITGNHKLNVAGTAGAKISSTNTGTGYTDWIALNIGSADVTKDRVVAGLLNGVAAIGAHNAALNAWAPLSVSPLGGLAVGGTVVHPSAVMDVRSEGNNQGVLLPRITTAQRDAIATPATGLIVNVTDNTAGFYYNAGTPAVPSWVQLLPANGNGSNLTNLNANNISGTVPIANLPTNLVRGAGILNYIPRFSTNSSIPTIGNSTIQDNGTSISMGLITPNTLYQAYIYRTQLTATGDGQSTTMNYRTRDSQNDGTGYGTSFTNRASSGLNFWGDVYTFGDASYNYNDFTRCGGNLGADVSGTYWGSSGYRSSGFLNYGFYSSGTNPIASGTGRFSSTAPAKGIGGGFVGDLMGSWSKGEVMGSISEGKLFASYNIGNAITDGKNIELVTTADGEKIPTYSISSASVAKIYNDGTGQLTNGKARVNFEASFLATLAKETKPTITISPVGGWANLYIAKIDATGFDVAEANNGTSNIEFNFIVVGKKLSLNETPVSSEVLNKNFSKNLPDVLFNEGNTKGSAKPMWWDGTKFNYTTPPLNATELEAQRKKKELIAQEEEALRKKNAQQ